LCPPGPGGRLPSSQIEPSSEERKRRVVIIMLSSGAQRLFDHLVVPRTVVKIIF
jgi:hypothetical protein